eukprot:923323-Pyramimonas_sp.AAC.1
MEGTMGASTPSPPCQGCANRQSAQWRRRRRAAVQVGQDQETNRRDGGGEDCPPRSRAPQGVGPRRTRRECHDGRNR